MEGQAVDQLRELASVLREGLAFQRASRAEDQAEKERARQLADERLEQLKSSFPIQIPKLDLPDAPRWEEIERKSEGDRQERRRFQADFLAELRRHNELLERLLHLLESSRR